MTANLLLYASEWRPLQRREAVYVGEPAGRTHLQATGLQLGSYEGGPLKADQVLILGPGSPQAGLDKDTIGQFLKVGGGLLAIGLTQEEADRLLPFKVSMSKAECYGEPFAAQGIGSLLVGVGPADVYARDGQPLPLIAGGCDPLAGGTLAVASQARVVFCQLVPWRLEDPANPGLRRTFRRTSFLVTRLLANLGAGGQTPLLSRFSSVTAGETSGRWLTGLYLDEPQEWDDPYRFFRW